MIDVEQRALRALEQHRGAADDGAVDLETDVLRERQQSLGKALEHAEGEIDIGALRPRGGELDVGVRDSALDQLSQALRVSQVENANAAAAVLVLVGRADSATSRSDLLAGRALAVYELVIRQHEVRAIADVQPALDVDPVRDQLVDLREQRLDVEHHSVADRAPHAGVQNSARDLVEHERLVADVHGVAGVGAALVANDPVRALGEDINELALAFVSPLRADDDDGACFGVEHRSALRSEAAGAPRRPREADRRGERRS